MFLGHDTGWWGLVIGSAALVLAVPLNILANFVTPLIKNWWAARSVASLQKRISVLEKKLAFCEQVPPISDEAHIALVSLQFALAGISYLILGGELLLQFTVEIAKATVALKDPITKQLLPDIASLPLQASIVLVVSLFITVALMFASGRIGGFLSIRGSYTRRRMVSSLEQLRAELKVRTGGAA